MHTAPELQHPSQHQSLRWPLSRHSQVSGGSLPMCPRYRTLIIRWHKNLISMNTFLVNHSLIQGVNRSRITVLTPTVYIVYTATFFSLRCRKISSLVPQRSQASNTPPIIYVSIHIYLSLSIFLYIYMPSNEYTLTVVKVSVGMIF